MQEVYSAAARAEDGHEGLGAATGPRALPAARAQQHACWPKGDPGWLVGTQQAFLGCGRKDTAAAYASA